jgi:hypothetical protein
MDRSRLPICGILSDGKKVVYKIADNIYFLTWFEKGTRPSSTSKTRSEDFVISTVADLNKKVATATYSEPVEEDGLKWMLDKAWIEDVE